LHDVIIRTESGKCGALVVNLSVNVLDYTIIVNGYQEGEGD
jgi:hypothetical protein